MSASARQSVRELLQAQGLALVRAVALLAARQRRRERPRATQLVIVFVAQPERDRDAFARLARAPRGSAERALFQLVSEHGLSGASDLLGLQALTDMMLGWIRIGAVPAQWADRLRAAAQHAKHGRRGPLPGNAKDDRRAMLAQLSQLSVRKAASILGVSRDTVSRWRAEESGGT